jgi:chromosomal replication initiator protein
MRNHEEGNLTEARSAQEIWEAALGELQIQVNKSNYRTWLQKTVGLAYQDDQFVVGVPNTFVTEYLDRNLHSLIEKTLIGLTNHDTKVVFQVDGRYRNSTSSYDTQEEILPSTQTSLPRFNSKYTFDSFVAGSGNRLAYAAALRAAENPGYSYNPLFIYGGVGLGKTHLLHAIGHVALANHTRVLYVSAEQFTNEFVNAIRHKKTEEFHHKYRSVDMLLIDDIHFISGKEQTEESFFHTFNELHNANHQIAITSNCPPKAIHSLESRLCSRFEWGLIADIQPPDLETRLAILQTKAGYQRVKIPLDVLTFIAQRAQQNIRELEGSLNRVIAFAKLTGEPPTIELAARALEDIASKATRDFSITPHLIVEMVANSFQLTPADLKSSKRDKETALARQVAMYLIRQETNSSLAQIGKELGGRDHSTVIHACEKIAGNLETLPHLRQKILNLQQKVHRQ